MANLWTLIRDCVHELELANDIRLDDSAWQRFKDLEKDIYALLRENNRLRENERQVIVAANISPDDCLHNFFTIEGGKAFCATCGIPIHTNDATILGSPEE